MIIEKISSWNPFSQAPSPAAQSRSFETLSVYPPVQMLANSFESINQNWWTFQGSFGPRLKLWPEGVKGWVVGLVGWGHLWICGLCGFSDMWVTWICGFVAMGIQKLYLKLGSASHKAEYFTVLWWWPAVGCVRFFWKSKVNAPTRHQAPAGSRIFNPGIFRDGISLKFYAGILPKKYGISLDFPLSQ